MYSQAFEIGRASGSLDPICSRISGDCRPKILVIDITGRLIEATAGARALLADGAALQRCFGRIVAATRADGARLAGALTKAARDGHARTRFDGAGDSLDADLVALHAEDAADVRIVIVLKPAWEERRQRLRAAETRFALTPAEARMLATLFEGCSVPEAAERLGVARTTARTHLQRMFDKTGVRRQADLLRLVGCA